MYTAYTLLATLGLASALTSTCTGTSSDEGGNWFCSQVKHIHYDGFTSSGSFQAVTSMDDAGACPTTDFGFDSAHGPLDEDLSIHLRGPIHLKAAAVYNLGSSATKRDAPSPSRVHGHRHLHAEKRTSNGVWSQIAYYNSERPKSLNNMVFLGNYGDQNVGSGVFDYAFGSSLSYLNAQGNGIATTATTLGDVTIPGGKEFSIWSAEKCDESCGYVRAEDVAYKGFSGQSKIFLFKFSMPHGAGDDMPAVWSLNGRIARTQQYGGCSCWDSGCGEVDFFEVLAPGDTKAKSTVHLADNTGGGSSDYFDRPVDRFVRYAVIFDAPDNGPATFSLLELPDHVKFVEHLDDAVVRKWIKGITS